MRSASRVITGIGGWALVLLMAVPSSATLPTTFEIVSNATPAPPNPNGVAIRVGGACVFCKDGGSKGGRGITFQEVSDDGTPLFPTRHFDTWANLFGATTNLVSYVNTIPQGRLTLVGVGDSLVKVDEVAIIPSSLIAALQSLGSQQIQLVGFRDAFALVGRKGATAPIAEAINVQPGLGWTAATASAACDTCWGDVDFDGDIDGDDAQLASDHAMGLITLSPPQSVRAEVSGDGSITEVDESIILGLGDGTIAQAPVAANFGCPPPPAVPVPLWAPIAAGALIVIAARRAATRSS